MGESVVIRQSAVVQNKVAVGDKHSRTATVEVGDGRIKKAVAQRCVVDGQASSG